MRWPAFSAVPMARRRWHWPSSATPIGGGSTRLGAGAFDQARGLFLQSLTAMMPVTASTYRRGASDFVLARCSGEQLEALLDCDAVCQAQSRLAMPLGAQIRLLDPSLWIEHE